ncbi:MAG TPA: HAD family acid phosphatase [Xanthobacteraceae bacterium]|nr:HAD family acid phosphatase [Xanthobacteraceae bacterium]
MPGTRARSSGHLPYALAGLVLFAAPAWLAPAATGAAQCPAAREPRLPPIAAPASNLGQHKKQLKAYRDGYYTDDLRLVFDDAGKYLQKRLAERVAKPAAVLDIDETALSTRQPTEANDFGFIPGGSCSGEHDLPCGFNDWLTQASAPAIPGAVEFFNAAVAKSVAVFFVTGRRDSQRGATLLNLDRAKFEGWAGLRTRPDNDHNKSVVPFKSGERDKIEGSGYTIVVNIGDQDSDLAGGHAECGFKLPNPFYFIE